MDSDASTSMMRSSQIGDEQIEELMSQYTRCYDVCSQAVFDNESQSFVVESQLDEIQVPVKLDFQAEFLKIMGLDSNDITQVATHERSICHSNTQQELDSQTDVEVIMTAYMTDNPFWNKDVSSKPLDLETFLERREYFVTIKTGINNEPRKPVENERNKNGRAKMYTLGPLVLRIEDVLKIPTECDESQMWRCYHTIYGQHFKSVVFYGRCEPIRTCAESAEGRNVKVYEVDDGNEIITVHYPHNDSKRAALNHEAQLLDMDYKLAQINGIPFLGENYHPSNPLCMKVLKDLGKIMNVIKRNTEIKQDYFTPGHKVLVIGRAFHHTDGTNHVFAYDMIEDGGKNRDFEINFKEHLVDVYRTKYLPK